MPGHKGRGICGFPEFDDVFSLDFTELDECGVEDKLVINMRATDELAAKYFGSRACVSLCSGSTQGLFAAMRLCKKKGKMIIARDCHISVLRAAALLDSRV